MDGHIYREEGHIITRAERMNEFGSVAVEFGSVSDGGGGGGGAGGGGGRGGRGGGRGVAIIPKVDSLFKTAFIISPARKHARHGG